MVAQVLHLRRGPDMGGSLRDYFRTRFAPEPVQTAERWQCQGVDTFLYGLFSGRAPVATHEGQVPVFKAVKTGSSVSRRLGSLGDAFAGFGGVE